MLRVDRTRSAACVEAVSVARESAPSTSMYSNPGREDSASSTQPVGLGVEMPQPLSSQTTSRGSGSFWWTAWPAALRAPTAVEWLMDASPRLVTTTASSGHGVVMPMRAARWIANASPTALGRCEAMVDVCGTMCRRG